MARSVMVVGNFPDQDGKFLEFGRDVALKLTGHAKFSAPPVPPPALTALLDTFEAAMKKGATTASDRRAKRVKVEAALRQDEAYIESVAALLPPEDVAAAIESTGFSSKKPGKRGKEAFRVKRGALEGSVVCDVKALGRHGTVQYCHSYSADGGKTWSEPPPTVDTLLIISGLPVGQTVSFRFRTLIKGVYGDWSQTRVLVIT